MGRYRLIEYAAAFDPADPPRSGRMVFFRPVASMGAPEKVTVPEGAVLGERETTVVRARRDGVRSARAPYWWMPIDAALPVLARSRLDSEGDASCQFWGAASLFALQLLARGRLCPDVTAAGFDTWRSTAQLPDEQEYFGVLSEAMPPQARALPFGTTSYPPSVPERSSLLEAFLDAAADSLSRVPGGSGPYAALAPQHVPNLVLGAGGRPAAGAPVSVQVSLRLEIEDVGDTGVRAVVQVQDVDPPQDLVDAGALWRRPAPPGSSDLARKEGTMVALRSAARAWPPLERLLEAPAPDAPEVSGDEVDDLFGDAVDDLVTAGCAMHWPRDLVRSLTMRAVLGPKQAGATPSGRLSPDALLSFRWQAALGEDGDLTEGEMDRLAEAKRPFVRLRDQWVRVDAAVLRKARRRKMADLTGFDAVAAALTGQVDVDGEVIEVEPAGWLATLRTVLTSPVPDTYGTARLAAEQLGVVDWSLVVLDEAQHVKNAASSTARALRSIPSRGRVALTGTPVENNLSELWAVLDWAVPGLLGPLKTFRTRLAKPIETHRDPAATAQLATPIRPFVLRRRKSDPGTAPELPPKTETSQYARLTREQAVLYEAVVRETMTKIEAAEGIARRGLVLKLLTALRQICNHPAQYLKEANASRLAGRSGKLVLVDELLSVMLAEQQAVLLFTQYVEMAKLLSARLVQQHVDHRLLHGGTPVASRPALVDSFQAGEFPVFVLSLRAAGTGLTLTRAQHVIFLDQWWNPAVMEQAADRAYRIGTRHPVQVHSLISEGTVEERIAELLAAKRDLADAVLSDVSEGLTELDDERLFDLIALRSSG
ncbi:DEAD/DEAH box helicase [Streptomyces sp. NPDC048109]|uniref:DEAD/DEAH box helicase n=1 Tax=unclassified Streptomyces TaxID=2593676 RepID=UPI00340D9794